MGLSFKGRTNFQSIPGLTVWVDSALLMNVNESNQIINFHDLSANNYFFIRRGSGPIGRSISGLIDLTNYVEESTRTPQYTVSPIPTKDFKFLHDGSPYLLYEIRLCKHQVGDPTTNLLSTTSNSSSPGISMLFTSFTEPAGTFLYTIRCRDTDGALILQRTNPVFSTKITTGEPLLFSHKSYGFGSNYGLSEANYYVDRVRVGGGNWSSFSNANPNPNTGLLIQHSNLFKNTEPLKFAIRMILIYNMTGYTGEQIDFYDSIILNLINETYGV